MLLRQDDTMVAVETTSAIIDFESILEAAEVVSDDHYGETPWDDCDGYAHTIGPVSSFNWSYDLQDARGCCWCDRQRMVIELTNDDWGIYDYQRDRGATKQVAAEAVASERRRTLDRLVNWYENGWEWWGVRCEFTVLGECFEDAVWGIDDRIYAENEVIPEMASEVAAQLEAAGFTVTNKPGPKPNRKDKKALACRNLNLQNWPD